MTQPQEDRIRELETTVRALVEENNELHQHMQVRLVTPEGVTFSAPASALQDPAIRAAFLNVRDLLVTQEPTVIELLKESTDHLRELLETDDRETPSLWLDDHGSKITELWERSHAERGPIQ